MCQGGAGDSSALVLPASFFRDRGGVEGGPGVRAGVAGGAELREALGAITSARLIGTGRGKDSRLRSSRRCQCGWARE